MMSLALGASLPADAFASAELTPPTVAPVLTADIAPGEYSTFLEWTASNKTGSAGFQYVVYVQIGANPEGIAGYTNDLFFVYEDMAATGETYVFRVVPENDAGEGPSSNIASVEIPGT